MSLREAVGRLVEPGERERRTQLETARRLLLRDGNRGQERVLSRRGVGRVVLEQHLTAGAMQFRFEGTMTEPLARRQGFVEDRKGAVDIAGAGFGFGKHNLD